MCSKAVTDRNDINGQAVIHRNDAINVVNRRAVINGRNIKKGRSCSMINMVPNVIMEKL